MAQVVNYGDISPRTAAYVIKDLLTRAMPYMVIEKFGQNYPIPQNSTQTAKWRRYFLQGATGSAGSGSGNYFVPLALTCVLVLVVWVLAASVVTFDREERAMLRARFRD